MTFAENRCRKCCTGDVDWTSALSRSSARLDLWDLVIKRLRGRRISSKLIKRPRARGASEESIGRRLKPSKPRPRRITKNSRNNRRIKWLTGLSVAFAAENKTTTAQEKENYIHREEQRKIKRVNGKLHAGSVTSVIAPNPHDPNLRLEMPSKVDMEEARLAENKRRFNQAADTPFMQPPLYDLFGPLGITKAADRILDGTFKIPPGVDKHTAGILRHMKVPDIDSESPPLRLDITTPEHIEAWRKLENGRRQALPEYTVGI
jgi:hypothetical protein